MKEIRFSSEKPYKPGKGYHASDIAVAVLAKPIEFNEWILPACIDWTRRIPFSPSGKMNFGKVNTDTDFGIFRIFTLNDESIIYSS